MSILSEGIAYLRETDFLFSADRLLQQGKLSALGVLGTSKEDIERSLDGLRLVAYNWELIRTVRQVVDIGVNLGLMDFDECVDYIEGHTPYDRGMAEHEMLRFFAYPGYPAGYPLVASIIQERRREAIRLGALAEFNAFTASLGWISSPRLADELDAWVARHHAPR
jgi:hypothetical protein